MKCWPVPESYSREVPVRGSPGSFWEDREDRHHCGIDIYAPEGSRVVAVETGRVIMAGVYSTDEMMPHWNTTYFVVIKNSSGLICKYAELGDVNVRMGDVVKSGQVIGYVGKILNPYSITMESPAYVQRLNATGRVSMLHFELFRAGNGNMEDYIGGNIFNGSRPENLLDPTAYLKGLG